MLDRAAKMQFPLCVNVGLLGKLFRWKRANKNTLSVNDNDCSPLVVALMYSKNSGDASTSCPSLVLSIPNSGYVSQVIKSVVQWVAVNVVNFFFGPATCHVKPSYPVRQVDDTTNRNLKTAVGSYVTYHITNFACFANHNAAGEYPGARVVIDKLSQPLCGKWGVNHFWHWQPRVKEVVNSVVASIFVLPAKVFLREFTVNVQPNESRRGVRNVVNVNSDSAVRGFSTSNIPGEGASAPCEPSENASVWVVVKKLFESSLREFRIGFSCHVKSLSMMVRSPFGVSSPSGLRHFSGYTPALQG